jgi:hypothetical protein
MVYVSVLRNLLSLLLARARERERGRAVAVQNRRALQYQTIIHIITLRLLTEEMEAGGEINLWSIFGEIN